MSETMMTVSTPTEVQVLDPVKPVVPEINLDPLAFQAEIAKIAAEQGNKIENGNVVPITPVPEPNQPAPLAVTKPAVQQIIAQPTVPVPQKFQTPDGQPDLNRIQKSTVNAEAALERYTVLERELRQKQNEVNKLRNQPPQQQQAAPTYVPPPQQPTNPWQQYPQYSNGPINPQMINEALAKGNPGQVLLELNQLARDEAYNLARMDYEAKVFELQSRFEAKERQTELQKIAETDPWVFSEEGIKTLGTIRQSKPWLNQAPEPWLEAYKSYKADQALSPIPQVETTIPMSQTVRAPATPVQGANRTQAPMPSLAALSRDRNALNNFLDQMTPEQQAQFWRQSIGAK